MGSWDVYELVLYVAYRYRNDGIERTLKAAAHLFGTSYGTARRTYYANRGSLPAFRRHDRAMKGFNTDGKALQMLVEAYPLLRLEPVPVHMLLPLARRYQQAPFTSALGIRQELTALIRKYTRRTLP